MSSSGGTPIYQVELLSRQVMRVVIPKGIYHQGGFVDVHVATPYGVSPHLAIPVICPPQTPPTTNLLKLDTDPTPMTIRCCWVRDDHHPCGGALRAVDWTPGSLDLKWTLGKALQPSNIVFQIAFATPKGSVPAKGLTVQAGQGGTFSIPASDVVYQLLKGLSDLGQYKPGDSLPPTILGTITAQHTDDMPVYDPIMAKVPQQVAVSIELVPDGHTQPSAPVQPGTP
jgi:hypothetical protein